MEWITEGVRMRPCLPPTLRETCGQNRFALSLNRETKPPMDFGSAGIAAVQTFILTSPARWMWAFATGQKKFLVKEKEEQQYEKENL